MDNFKKYFIKPKCLNVDKKIEKWKENCDDFKHFSEQYEVNPENIYLFYFPEAGICAYYNCSERTKFISLGRGFKDCCTKEHTCLVKYGVSHPTKCKEIKEKVKDTLQKNYGVDNPSRSKEVKEKRKNTVQEKYGVGNVFQSEEVKEKSRLTIVEKYGVDNVSKLEETKEKK